MCVAITCGTNADLGQTVPTISHYITSPCSGFGNNERLKLGTEMPRKCVRSDYSLNYGMDLRLCQAVFGILPTRHELIQRVLIGNSGIGRPANGASEKEGP